MQLPVSQVHKQGSKSDYRQPRPRQIATSLLDRSCHDQYSRRLTGVEDAARPPYAAGRLRLPIRHKGQT